MQIPHGGNLGEVGAISVAPSSRRQTGHRAAEMPVRRSASEDDGNEELKMIKKLFCVGFITATAAMNSADLTGFDDGSFAVLYCNCPEQAAPESPALHREIEQGLDEGLAVVPGKNIRRRKRELYRAALGAGRSEFRCGSDLSAVNDSPDQRCR